MHRTAVSLMILATGLMAANYSTRAQTPAAAIPAAPAAATSSSASAANPSAPAAAAQPAWIVRSNQYTQMLLDVQMKHSPERASQEGLVKYDSSITDATRADEIAQRKELQIILANLKKIEAKEKDRDVREDLEILQKAFNLQFREDDYLFAHNVQFIDASQAVYTGLSTLLDDKVPAGRRAAAVIRLRKYAGVEPGFKPFTDVLKQRTMEQMANPAMVYPSANEMESELARNKNYIDGMRTLFVKYKLTGWEEPFDKLQQELAGYDTWARATVMPRAGINLHMTPEEYAFSLENTGVDLPPSQLATQAQASFTGIQAEMAPLAVEVARQHGWASSNYRDVIRQLKKTQLAGDAILPFYQARLKAIEEIVVAKNLVTLPDHSVTLSLVAADGTAQQPAPNTGQKGESVLPLNIPTAPEGSPDTFDDFTYDAVAWPMTAHVARPGQELLFNSMQHHGVSLARELYASNSTNIEAWGLYSEWIIQPYEPAEGQLITLQLRLLRAALVFLNSGLQSGKITPDDAAKVLQNDVVLSPAFAREEMENLIFSSPGQAYSGFYGYTQMLQLRKDTEAALGPKFDAKQFHDFLLAQGPLPPDLLRRAVMQDFIPAQKKKK
jgi:uncharacterized protein (DUF885 family)